MTSTLALFGPGDFSSWSGEVFHRASRGGPALVLSFGVVPMGREHVPQLRKMATDHLDSLGIPHLAVEADDAGALDATEHLALLSGAGFVYMQGGSSSYIADTLRKSAFLREAQRLAVPWVATSGGTMAAGRAAVDFTVSPMWSGPGVGIRDLTFSAHWDTFGSRIPGFVEAWVAAAGEAPLVALDEETALIHAEGLWSVLGEGRVHVHHEATWESYGNGDTFSLSG